MLKKKGYRCTTDAEEDEGLEGEEEKHLEEGGGKKMSVQTLMSQYHGRPNFPCTFLITVNIVKVSRYTVYS